MLYVKFIKLIVITVTVTIIALISMFDFYHKSFEEIYSKVNKISPSSSFFIVMHYK